MSKAAGRIARKAAEIIETRGWHQGGWTNRVSLCKGWGKAEVCIRGAFNLATWGNLREHPSKEEVEFTEWLDKIDPLPKIGAAAIILNSGYELDLGAWNDARHRTKEEVLAYLNKFAEEQDPGPVTGEVQ